MQYKEVQNIAKTTIEFIKDNIQPNMTLLEIRNMCETKMMELGADSFWYWDVGAFVFSGEETTLSVSGKEYSTSHRVIAENDIITIDSLFDNDIIAHYHKVNKRCGFFYKTQHLPLYYNLRPNTLQFVLRNSQLQYFIDNEFDVHRYKVILIQLEEEMFSYTKHSLHYVSNEIYEYHIFINQKD